MNTWARKSFKVGVLSAGVLLFAGTAANADLSLGNSGFLSGNQISATTQAPVDICGNAIGIVGNAQAGCVGGSWAALAGGSSHNLSIGNSGIGSGNQISATTQAPVNVCGNAVGIFGNSKAGCFGGSAAAIGGGNGGDSAHGHGQVMTAPHVQANSAKKSYTTESTHVTEATDVSVGNSGIGSGNQISSVIQAPIDICGNAVGIVGNAQASCVGGATASSDSSGVPALTSGFNSGILSGNQVTSIIQAPVNVCGNAISLVGNSSASCVGGSEATIGGGNGGNWGGGGNGGGGNGGGGNGGGWGGDGGYSGHSVSGGTENVKSVKGVKAVKTAKVAPKSWDHAGSYAMNSSCIGDLTSIGNSGFLSGNQIAAVTQAPTEISGNALSFLGNSQAWSIGGTSANC